LQARGKLPVLCQGPGGGLRIKSLWLTATNPWWRVFGAVITQLFILDLSAGVEVIITQTLQSKISQSRLI